MSKLCIPLPSTSVIGVASSQASAPSSSIFRVETEITTISGSGSNSLKSIATATGSSYPVGICVFLPNATPPSTYQLVAANTAENIPFVVRPADYSTATNEKVWVQRM
jgi:hypothetical protein